VSLLIHVLIFILVIPCPSHHAHPIQPRQTIDASSYLTLEKFVHELARTALLHPELSKAEGKSLVEAVTVKARKPSALSFANFSGVEVTRRRDDFV